MKQLKLHAVKENTDASKIIERLVKEYLKKMSDEGGLKPSFVRRSRSSQP
jgi:hypothetical protein